MEFKSVIAVIPAAGVGSRMKADHPKQYLSIAGDSTPTVLQACIASLSAVSQINRIVVGVSPADGYAADLDLGKAELFRTGGATRSETVLNTLKAIGTETLKDALVLVHDAARPLVDPDDVTELIDKAKTDILKHGPLAGAVLAVRLWVSRQAVGTTPKSPEKMPYRRINAASSREKPPAVSHSGTRRRPR